MGVHCHRPSVNMEYNDLIDLGVSIPELRPHIRQVMASMDIIAEPRYRDYVRRYKGPGSPMKKEEWEARVLGKKPSDSGAAKKERKPRKAPAKKWHPKVMEVMQKHNLTDVDADEVKAFKNDKPASGAKVSPSVLMQRFLAKAKPETKERMKGVSPGDFMKILAAIMDDGEGAVKMASFKQDLVKLGAENPELRQHIRPILAAGGKVRVPDWFEDAAKDLDDDYDNTRSALKPINHAHGNGKPVTIAMMKSLEEAVDEDQEFIDDEGFATNKHKSGYATFKKIKEWAKGYRAE